MSLQGLRIGYAVTGSHCTLRSAMQALRLLADNRADLVPIVSPTVRDNDTRFGRAEEWLRQVRELTGKEPLCDIVAVEPIGPQGLCDVLVIAPCTGNTLAKLCSGITDTCVLMAAKAHLRNQRPLVLAVSTNDGLSGNAKNIGQLLNMKNIYFVPFGQDNCHSKPNSIIADFSLLPQTVDLAVRGEQQQPLLINFADRLS